MSDEAALTEDEMLQQLQAERMFSTPLPLPTRFSLAPVVLSETQSGVAVAIETPAGSMRVIWEQEFAMAFASALRKAAQTGASKLVVPQKTGLVIPGR